MPKVTKTNLNRTVKCNVCSGWFKRQGMQKHFKAKHFNALGIGQKMRLDNLYRECNLGKLDTIVKIKGLCDRNEKNPTPGFMVAYKLNGPMDFEAYPERTLPN